MYVPKPRKLPSGSYNIKMVLGGVSVSVTRPTAAQCTREATLIKAEHVNDKKRVTPTGQLTPRQCFDEYLRVREHSLSPLTIRGYRTTQKHRFAHTLMDVPVSQITKEQCQRAVDLELKSYSQKTVKNAYADVKTVVKDVAGVELPRVSLPVALDNTRPFLQPEEIPAFIEAAAPTKYAVPLLLALSSLRISEISALRWSDIPADCSVIHVRGARVLDEHNEWVEKRQNKTRASARDVPVLIPELADAIRRDRNGKGYVMPCTQNNLRVALHKICESAGVTDVSPHGLRHSFASLCYHLNVPKKIVQEIGGWEDAKTMDKIYTHIAKTDLTRYQNELAQFFQNRNGNRNEN